jgi:predicted double-glycine peptidase
MISIKKPQMMVLGGMLAGVALAGGGIILFGGYNPNLESQMQAPIPVKASIASSQANPLTKIATLPQGVKLAGVTLPNAVSANVNANLASSAVPEVKTVLSAYSQKDYPRAEKAAQMALVSLAAKKPVPAVRKVTLRMKRVAAFAMARQGKLKEAQAQFEALKVESLQVPEGKERPQLVLGQGEKSTIAEDAAYQHAVCTAALGDKANAEKEFMSLIRTYPESPIVHASVKRIARLHGGDIPAEATKAWQEAMGVVKKREDAQRRQAAMCAPACLKELLKRKGETIALESLAKEMKTDKEGTTLESLRDVLRSHGYPNAEGVALTMAGLRQQKLPLIALISPGHFVLVEKIGIDGSVTIWDANSVNHIGETRTLTISEWEKAWQGGVAITLSAVKITEPAGSVSQSIATKEV